MHQNYKSKILYYFSINQILIMKQSKMILGTTKIQIEK